MKLNAEKPEPGIYPDVPFPVYAKLPAANASTLVKFKRSAAHARTAILTDGDKPAYIVGRAIHTATLEPEFFEARYVEGVAGDGRTKTVKDARAELAANFPNHEVLLPSDWAACIGTRDAVWAHPDAREILSGKGFNEVTIIGEVRGQLCKVRLDRLTTYKGFSTIVDLKSTRDASPETFARDCANFDYHTKSAFYCDVVASVSDVPRRFLHVACEKTDPFGVAVYELGDLSREQGRNDYQNYLRAYARAHETNEWPGYPTGVQALDVPRWAIHADEWVDEGES